MCNKLYYATPWHAPRSKYCSRTCYYRGMTTRKSVMLTCQVCGKEYKRCPSGAEAETKTKTCSWKCRGIATRKSQPEAKSNASVRSWLKRRNMIVSCEDCGYDENPDILVIHHRDRDHRNNILFNLAIICPNCHALEHLNENKKGWSHASSKRVKSKDYKPKYSRDV